MNASPDALQIFGITLIGATPENLRKLALTAAFIVVALVLTWALRALLRMFVGSRAGTRFQFWAKQAVSLVIAAILILGIASIWFDNPARLGTVVALVGAGVAFAMQRVVTAVAGYLVILRGKTFNVGDRIVMGGVRGDVIALSFMQTKIMEMGQPSPIDPSEPARWVKSRQFTGRIVTVTNDKIFDDPVYNYTDEFPYVWDEMSLQIHFSDNRDRAEAIMLEAARRHAVRSGGLGEAELERLERHYGVGTDDIEPTVFWRFADGWLELTVRFLSHDHGTRRMKDSITREILSGFEEAGIGIASSSLEITALPPLRIERGRPAARP